MNEKNVVLIRKQNRPFTVNFPIDGRIKKYKWLGTRGKVLDKKPIPFEVYDWLVNYTTTFQEGDLIIENNNDPEVKELKENIEDVEIVEKAILTKSEIEKILTTGNHLILKKELEKMINGLSDKMIENQKRNVISVATEIGIDSSSKRKVISDWAGFNYETSDLMFDKELNEMYEKETE